MQKNKTREIILIILASIIFILLAMNSTVFFSRMDLTKNKSFTISDATKKIISSIPDRVHITYFISDKIKAITPVPLEIEDILYEYAAHSKGRITVNCIDPASAGMTSKAESLGITPQQIEVYEKNEQSYAVVYSGIVIQYMDKIEAIPFTITLETVEYDIAFRIRKLVEEINLTLGLLIGDSAKNIENHYTYLNEIMGMRYDQIDVISPGTEISPSISVLAVIGNKDLTDGDMLYVDDYIMNGGKVFFAIDGVNVDVRNLAGAAKLEKSPAIEMLKKYGITVNNDLVLDKYVKRIPLKGTFPMLYPLWIGILGQNVSTGNPITSRFGGLDLLWASSVTVEEREGMVFERLLASTDQAWTLDSYITVTPQEVGPLMNYKGADQRQIALGYVVSGTFKSAFTDKTGKSRIIVIGDSDFVSDIIEFSDSPYNIGFFENAIEWLSNDDSLLQIKTRDRRDLRLNKIEVPEKKVTAILLVYLVNIVIIPLSIIIFAIVHFIRRKKREV